jgi:hypothetical protein
MVVCGLGEGEGAGEGELPVSGKRRKGIGGYGTET